MVVDGCNEGMRDRRWQVRIAAGVLCGRRGQGGAGRFVLFVVDARRASLARPLAAASERADAGADDGPGCAVRARAGGACAALARELGPGGGDSGGHAACSIRRVGGSRCNLRPGTQARPFQRRARKTAPVEDVFETTRVPTAADVPLLSLPLTSRGRHETHILSDHARPYPSSPTNKRDAAHGAARERKGNGKDKDRTTTTKEGETMASGGPAVLSGTDVSRVLAEHVPTWASHRRSAGPMSEDLEGHANNFQTKKERGKRQLTSSSQPFIDTTHR